MQYRREQCCQIGEAWIYAGLELQLIKVASAGRLAGRDLDEISIGLIIQLLNDIALTCPCATVKGAIRDTRNFLMGILHNDHSLTRFYLCFYGCYADQLTNTRYVYRPGGDDGVC